MTRLRARSLIRLAEEFGAYVEVSKKDPEPLSKVERARARCARVEDAVPMHYPSLIGDARFAVVYDDALDTPRRDGTRKLARNVLVGALHKAGVDSDSVAWGHPNADLLAQLHAADVGYVLLAGSQAVAAWRRDLRVSKVAGRVGIMGGQWYVGVVVHPLAVVREPTLVRDWEQQIREFVEVVDAGAGMEMLADRCVVCTEPLSVYDADGMAWCAKHGGKGMSGAAHGGTRWPDRNQSTLDL